MDPGAMAVIATFYNNIDVFLLIFVRIIGFFMFLPVVSSLNIPMQVRLAVALALSVVIFSAGVVTVAPYNDSITGYFGLMLTEFLVGVFLGYVLYFIFAAVLFAGQMIDYQIGFSMVSVLDPTTQIQVPLVGNFFYLSVSAMLVVSGGVHSFVSGFFYTYQLLPIGTGHLIGNAPLAWYVLVLLNNFLLMGVKIALPVIASMLIIDVALGVMVKAVPQMNVFVVGMPIKVFAGLLLLFTVLAPSMNIIYNQLFDNALIELANLAWGMVP